MNLLLVAVLGFISATSFADARYGPSYGRDHIGGKTGKDPDWCAAYQSYCQYESIKVECQHTCNVTTEVEPSWCATYKNLCDQKSIKDSCPITCIKAIHGNWGEWSSWNACSVSCGQGDQKRHRSCDNPSPSAGGHECEVTNGGNHAMKEEQHRECNSNRCPIHGGYGDWSSFSTCTVTCGTGTQYKHRCCTSPFPKNGGDDCSKLGSPVEPRPCNTMPCPVHGNYSEWSGWDTCNATCGGGSQMKMRTCTNPAPLFGGHSCSKLGDAMETRACNEQPCPIDGGYSDFTPFSRCSKSCGGGVRYRSRCCNSPIPAFGGKPCVLLGEPVEIQACGGKPCPIDGNWGEWEAFGACTKTCGTDGGKTRTRACNNPTALHGGKDCPGDASETVECNRTPCPVDGGLTEWADWSDCSATCGTSTQTRSRACTNPAPAHGGDDCVEVLSETNNCNVPKCAEYDYGLTPSTWENAEQACVAWGGHLVTIQNEAEMALIVSGLTTAGVVSDSNSYVWIGLNDKITASEYKWVDGSTSAFTNWGSGEPSHNDHHCVSINMATKTWWDRNCPTLYPYVCEK